VGASSLHNDMSDQERQHMTTSLDLPPQFGRVGLQSLVRAADEEMLGSWASISSDLITYFKSKNLPVYDSLVEALDEMADEDHNQENTIILVVESLLAVIARARVFLADILVAEMEFATSTVMGERLVEIHGRYTPP